MVVVRLPLFCRHLTTGVVCCMDGLVVAANANCLYPLSQIGRYARQVGFSPLPGAVCNFGPSKEFLALWWCCQGFVWDAPSGSSAKPSSIVWGGVLASRRIVGFSLNVSRVCLSLPVGLILALCFCLRQRACCILPASQCVVCVTLECRVLECPGTASRP